MRKLNASALTLVMTLISLNVLGAAAAAWQLNAHLGFLTLPAFVLMAAALSLAEFLALRKLRPVQPGDLVVGSRNEFSYDVFVVWNLFCFHVVTESRILPIPIRTMLYRLLGARLGAQTFPSGHITDPFLFAAGDYCIIGMGSICTSHIRVGSILKLDWIRLGHRVTIGAQSVVMPGVRIDDDAVVAASSFVPANTHIGAGEVWGGVPAKLISRRGPADTTA